MVVLAVVQRRREVAKSRRRMVVVEMRAGEPRLAVYKADRDDRISEGTIVRRLGKRRVLSPIARTASLKGGAQAPVAYERDRAFT